MHDPEDDLSPSGGTRTQVNIMAKALVLGDLSGRVATGARFALLRYRTQNLGDEIQSLAARCFLPRVDALVDRDELNTKAICQPHKIILNGWFSHRPECWPPSEFLVPLLISFHVTQHIDPILNPSGKSFSQRVGQVDSRAYLASHSPVGARDTHTVELLRNLSIPAYFSACLTLTLTAEREPARRDFVCVNDLDDEVVDYVERKSRAVVVITRHRNEDCLDPVGRMTLAHNLLETYASAKFVVTSRLHCALPCLALGTPVLFCPTATDRYRFSGLLELLRHTSRAQLLSDLAPFDFCNPTPNGMQYLPLRQMLIDRCRRFIAED